MTELAYVFGHDSAGERLAAADARLSHGVIVYWTSLAAAGDPNRRDNLFGPFLGPVAAPEDCPYWPSFAQPAGSVLSLAVPASVESDFAAKHHCALGRPSATRRC